MSNDEISDLKRQLEEAEKRKRKAEGNWSAYRPGACFGRRTNTSKKFVAWKVIRIFREESIWEEYLNYEDKETEVLRTEGPHSEWPTTPVTPEAFLKVGQTYTSYGYTDAVLITQEEYDRLRNKVIYAIKLGQNAPDPKEEDIPKVELE